MRFRETAAAAALLLAAGCSQSVPVAPVPRAAVPAEVVEAGGWDLYHAAAEREERMRAAREARQSPATGPAVPSGGLRIEPYGGGYRAPSAVLRGALEDAVHPDRPGPEGAEDHADGWHDGPPRQGAFEPAALPAPARNAPASVSTWADGRVPAAWRGEFDALAAAASRRGSASGTEPSSGERYSVVRTSAAGGCATLETRVTGPDGPEVVSRGIVRFCE